MKVTTLIDMGFAKSGSWQIGDKTRTLPAEKASPPHIGSLNGTTFWVKMKSLFAPFRKLARAVLVRYWCGAR